MVEYEIKSEMVCVRVTPVLLAKLRKAADLDKRTLSDFARILWENALEPDNGETDRYRPPPRETE